ncbi:MAG TPA: GtrA family protein [Polyangiaceae bacterium]|nr:GtrA family protein [Polyangiaceae bacterium]HMR74554.1 GtrA family protein [Polyangiaceae bacterium]
MVNPKFLAGLWIVIRSSAVGLLATATDLVVLALLVSGVGMDPRVASLPALCLGIGIQFVGNKWFAFENRERAWARQGAQFLAVETLGFGANLVLFDLVMAHSSLPYLPVRLVTTSLVYFGICLPLWSRIFKPKLEEA